jgi:hypothetical protein
MSNKLQTNQVSGTISPYSQAMARCLSLMEEAGGEATDTCNVHHLTNLVQGRMLEFLADEICRERGIAEPDSRSQIVTALLGIFSDEFFALFRAKLEKRPDLAVLIARRIIRGEFEAAGSPPTPNARRALDRLFPAIFRKYFEYRKLDSLQRIVETDAQIQKIILLALLKQRTRLNDTELYQKVARILDEDAEGLCPNLFLQYVTENRIDLLQQRIRSGAWREDMESLKQKIAVICGR